MYGWINGCLEDLITTNYGVDAWQQIRKDANVEGDFFRSSYYSDESTVKLISAGAKFLNQTAESLLEQFGAHFIHYLESYGYGRTMRCQGSTFREWIRNVNEPHRLLKSRFPDSSFPEFWLEDNAADLNGNSVILHYTSQRTGGLAPIVVGIVKEAASFYFGLAIEMVDFQDQQSPSAGKYHGRWTLVGLNNEPNKIPSVLAGEENTRRTSSKSPCVSPVKGTESRCPFHHYQSSEPSSPIPAHLPSKDDPSMFAAANDVGDDVGVNGHVLKRIFPFHIVVNQQMEVVQIGHKLRELVDMRWKLPKMLRTFIGDHFRITLPSHFEWNWDELRTLQRMTIEMVLTSQLVNREGKHVNLKFRGEVIFLDEGDNAVDMSEFDQDVIRTPRSNRKYLSGRPNNSSRAAFFINPDITNMDDLLSLHMKLTDLPRHGFQADLLLIDEHLKTETSYALKLTEISRNLDLESRKAKEALKMKRIFVRYVSHEIRTPLNIAILGLKCLEHELTERYPWILQEIADDAAANALIAEDDDDDEEVDEADIVNLRDNSVSMSNIMPSMGIASDAQSHSIHGTPGTSPRPSAHHRALSKLPPRPLSSLSSPHRLASIPNSVKPPPVCDGRQNSGKVIRAAENLFVNTSILSPNVQSVASFLENGKPAGEESLISTIMDEIKTSCTVAVDILNDLLLYEKIDNGIFDMAKHPTNLHDLLDESIKLFRVQAKGADVDFQMDDHQMVTEGQSCVYGFELASPLSTPSTDNHHRSNRHSHQAHTPTSGAHVPAQSIISALDRSKIQQVLRNLFTNAVKFTPPGGRVTLSYAIFGPDAPSLIPKTQKEGIGARQMMNTSLFYNCYSTVSNSASVSSVCLSSAPPSTSTSSLSSSTLLMPNLSLEQPSVAHAMVAAPTAPSAKDFPITFAEDVPNFSSHFARIAISDTGPGISSSDQCTLFHEFIQVKADKLQNGQGSGLGLWIAATIMKMHGGRIGVVSAGEGHGSTFLVDIPITPPPAPAQTSAVDKNSSIGGITPPFLLDPQGLQTTSSRHNSFAQEEYPTAENHLVSLVKESVRKGSMSGLNSPSPRNTTKASDPRCCSTDDEHIEYMDDEDDYSDTDSGKWDDFAHLLVKVEAQIERDDRMHSTPMAVAAAAVGQETTSVSNSGWQVGRDFLISLSPKERQRFLQHLQSMPSTAGMAAIVTRNASFRGRSGTNSVPASPSVRSGHEILRPLASSIVWRPRKTLREARVLIVDDAPTNRKMIRRLLHRHFDYLDEADNGLTAVNKFKEALPILPWKPTSEAAAILSQDSEEDVEREPSESKQGYDLILMDFMMPHMNGPDATLLIKQIAAEQHFPVIIIGVTGNGLPEDIQAFHNHGADEVMVKPLEFDRFMHYLQNHIHFAN